jgi:hypothetical protein
MTQTVMKSLNHHPPLLTSFLPDESGGILKEVVDH